MDYEAWLAAIDAWMLDKLMFSLYDLPDEIELFELWDEGHGVESAARTILAHHGLEVT